MISGSFLLPMMLVIFVVIAIAAAGLGISSLYRRRVDGESFSLAMCVKEVLYTVKRMWEKMKGWLMLKQERLLDYKRIRHNRREVYLNLKDFKRAVKKYGKISVPVPQQLIDDIRKQSPEKMCEIIAMLTVALQYHESCYGSDMISALAYDFPETELKERLEVANKKKVKSIKSSKAMNGKKK